ncbi:MAG TPA: hypothetical protein VGF99_15785 [Myxococcota bacterium]
MHTPDPSDSSSSLSAAADAPCPKCGWRQSPMSASCAACGLIFARYHAARERPTPSTPASSSSLSSSSLSSSAVEAGAASIVGSATTSSSSVVVTLFGLHAAPILAVSAVGFAILWLGGTVVVEGLAALGGELARVGAGHGVSAGAGGLVVGAAVALATFVALVTVVVAAVTSASTIVVDEHMRTGDDRGVVDALREGTASALPVAGVFGLVGLGGLVPMALGVAVSAATSSTAIAVVATVVGVVATATIVVRSSLAVPAVVLGERGIIDAVIESWRLTGGRALSTLGTLLLGGAVAMVIGGVAAFLAWIPVLGVVLTLGANAIGNGIASGVAAGLWRARNDA